jgi:glycolate oxidase
MFQNFLLDRLREIAGEQNVSDDPETLRSHSRDPGPYPPLMPGVVVTPTGTEIVSRIMRFCNEAKTPVLPFGSAYSFTGTSNRRGSSTIALDMKKMDRIIEINEENLTVRAEAGAIVGNVSDEVRKRGFYLNTVAVPYYRDTLGGMLSGVIGGGHPLYSTSNGLNNRDVVGLKVVLPSGEVVETNPLGSRSFMRDTNSPDITGMFIGDGGIFGVKTEAVMAMHPIPPAWKSGAAVFSSFEDAFGAISEACKVPQELLCDYLTMLSPEITEIYSAEMEGKFFGAVYFAHGFTEHGVDAKVRAAEAIFRKHGAQKSPDALVEFSEGIRTGEVYWKANEYTETMVHRGSCAFFSDAGSFKEIFLKLYAFMEERMQGAGGAFTPAYVIHGVGRNSLWANIIVNYESRDAEVKAYSIIRDLHALAAKLGVAFETHSGHAADLMGEYWSSEFRELILKIKKALDPNNVLNPGLWLAEPAKI